MSASPPPESRGTVLEDELPLGWRIVLSTAGTLLIVLGVAGLFLPGPGLLGIAAGAALLSVASRIVHRALHRCCARWPHGWERFERFRHRVLVRITGVETRTPERDEAPPEGGAS